ncbi:MAG: hypothetical protein A2023_03750 [Sulfuricurvum sp. GWF2_44_89]|nr:MULTISPECIES: hypothetical protein [Sulfuricurvum]OHD78005.1 MAG: hypothetical protein A2023_03750 [Sulfuricurvum sp. GWF2_44_89]
MKRAVISRVVLYSIAAIVAFGIYERSQLPVETDEEYCERRGMVKIHEKFFKYDVYEHDEMKPIVDMLTKECNGDSYCEIDRAYQYVLKIPYKESTVNRNPSDVINQNGGDCDEKSFLLATLLLQNKYPCLLVTTKDHGFIAVHLPDDRSVKHPSTYLIIDGKKYYFADTTLLEGYIGQYNNVKKDDINGVFDMVVKKEIPLDQIEYHFLTN